MSEINKIKGLLDNLLDSSKPGLPAWNVEAVLGHIKPTWNYIDGCMIKAVLAMYEITNEEKYFNFADDFVDYYINENGEILGYQEDTYNCDNINEGKVLFPLYEKTGKEKYRKAIEILYGQLLRHPRISTGNFWHKKIYENQVWLDGLYMVQPFYIEYAKLFGDKEKCDDAISQLKNVYNLMRDEKTGLLYHGYDDAKECFWANPETGLSQNFWTRSIGWYTMAMIDSIELLGNDFKDDALVLQNQLKNVLDSMLAVADEETGMFYQVPNMAGKEGNYIETSGTCAVAYSLMKAARLGVLDGSYFEKGKRILESVIKTKLVMSGEKFVLKDICLVAGLGVYEGKGNYKTRDGSYEYYISEPKVENDAKGVAPFLLAFTELLRKSK